MNAEELVKFAAKSAERMFKSRGEVLWMYHFVTAGGEHGIFSPPPGLDKDEIIDVVKAIFVSQQAVAYVYLNEAWTMESNLGRDEYDALMRAYGSLEHVPGRIEEVSIIAEDANCIIAGRMRINRPAGHKPYLSKLEVSRPDGMEGRMVGLLPKYGTVQ